MKRWRVDIWAQKTVVVAARTKSEARKKAGIKFRGSPGRLFMEFTEGPG